VLGTDVIVENSAATITERQKKKATKERCKQKARVAGGGGGRCPHCTV
jgi:hypothetical protein